MPSVNFVPIACLSLIYQVEREVMAVFVNIYIFFPHFFVLADQWCYILLKRSVLALHFCCYEGSKIKILSLNSNDRYGG